MTKLGLLLVACCLIAASCADPSYKEEKLETALNEIEAALQGLRVDDEPVPKVEIEGDLADMMKSHQRTFKEDLEEVLLHTDDIGKAEKELKDLGGRVKIQLGHELLVADVPSKVAADHAFTQSSTHISSSASATTLRYARAYNMYREDKLKPEPPAMSWTAKTPPKAFPREDSDALIQGESPYRPTLNGKIAYVMLIPSGPGDLAISSYECDKIISEAISGACFWYDQACAAGQPLSFVAFYGYASIPTDNPGSCSNAPSCHDIFANPTLQAFGFSTDQAGRDQVAQYIKDWARADGAFIGYFSKYRQSHFAYAYFGGGPTYMQYSNDGWGTDRIDRVFAHEMGHIFNAPDEYTNCGNCNNVYGPCGEKNGNCFQCTPNQQSCIMNNNDFNLCEHTKKHIGWC